VIRIYLAAPYPLIASIRALADELEVLHSIHCVSRWMHTTEQVWTHEHALMDLKDILFADVFVAINPAEWSNSGTGGRHFELGFAYAMKKPIILVGARTNIFHHLDPVHYTESLVIESLAELIQRVYR
jgi:nucleoside 2-deoxyribosyltransferase